MDESLRTLCAALKNILSSLKTQHEAVSFLLLTGKNNQGKTTLLRQSHYEHLNVNTERGADIYYNEQSVILELGESWLNQSKNLLKYTLKQLNNCHRTVKICGLMLCVDIHDLFIAEPIQCSAQSKIHAQFLERFGLGLGYRVETTILFTKLDVLAGFCDFFQHEHAVELQKPLGFSISNLDSSRKWTETYTLQFEHFIEVLGQQVIHKIHPARSSLKRTLIREFPLQLASLHTAIHALIQNISPRLFSLNTVYFTSAEQGGVSLDKLNKKIQHEYGLTVQDHFPQSTNYQAYFIDGALRAFHTASKQYSSQNSIIRKVSIGLLSSTAAAALMFMSYHYIRSSHLLDVASTELSTYDVMIGQKSMQTSALYHLATASTKLDEIAANNVFLPIVQKLKTQLSNNSKQNLNDNFLPKLTAELETTITNNQESPSARYDALKIYLMLADKHNFVQTDVEKWFYQHWKTSSKNTFAKQRDLLKRVLNQPKHNILINHQIIRDTRNYLNALPAAYLYYSLAKQDFSQDTQQLQMKGFKLATSSVPIYLTKKGFDDNLTILSKITSTLHAENWVLARQDIGDLQKVLQQAYCHEYVAWWQNFMRNSAPLHTHNYEEARELTQSLYSAQEISNMMSLLQQQLGPKTGDNASIFNQEIASNFTQLSLVSHTAIRRLTTTLQELSQFLATLAVIKDNGKTAFILTKARFQGDTLNNPLTSLYSYAQQLPDPASSWAKHVADDTWFTLINDSRNYINQQWHNAIIPDYHTNIAQRYPFDTSSSQDISLEDFNRFFANTGVLNQFIEEYLKPFLDTSQPQWALKESNNYVLPITPDVLNELIRANIVTHMFFPNQSNTSHINFSLQKLNLDPIVASLKLSIGKDTLTDTQTSDSLTSFTWPTSNATLVLNSIEGKHYTLEELGPWAFFKILQKVNVLIDDQDNGSLQILFEINGNSGRYLLKTENEVNPFTPGILNGFSLPEIIV